VESFAVPISWVGGWPLGVPMLHGLCTHNSRAASRVVFVSSKWIGADSFRGRFDDGPASDIFTIPMPVSLINEIWKPENAQSCCVVVLSDANDVRRRRPTSYSTGNRSMAWSLALGVGALSLWGTAAADVMEAYIANSALPSSYTYTVRPRDFYPQQASCHHQSDVPQAAACSYALAPPLPQDSFPVPALGKLHNELTELPPDASEVITTGAAYPCAGAFLLRTPIILRL